MKGVEGRQPQPFTGKNYGIRYDMEFGGTGGNTNETMVLVSVGSEFPAGIKVQPRVPNPALADRAVSTYGCLPPITTFLQGAAADLMATASVKLQTPNADLVRLCLDVPGKQRSKQYYLNTIEEFVKHCEKPLGKLDL